MKIEICDRCKRLPDEKRVPYEYVTLSFEAHNIKTLDFWLGKNKSVTLCTECLRDFWDFSGRITSQ